jgi:hypothetical protein
MTAAEPLFRVVAGHPTDEETAALAAVLGARLAAGPPAGHRPSGRGPAGRWADPARSMRPPLTPGPRAWRNSARPG